MTRSQVRKLISQLIAAPKKAQPTVTVPEVGMYRADSGEIVRVYFGQQSGKNLVKRIVSTYEGQYSYEYIGSAESLARGRTRMGAVKLEPLTLEEAKAWGQLTGTCCVCARVLTDPDSVDAGIGPVCAKKF